MRFSSVPSAPFDGGDRAERPEYRDPGRAGVRADRVGADDRLVDATQPAFERDAVVVDDEVVRDVAVPERLDVVRPDPAHDPDAVAGPVDVAVHRVVHDRGADVRVLGPARARVPVPREVGRPARPGHDLIRSPRAGGPSFVGAQATPTATTATTSTASRRRRRTMNATARRRERAAASPCPRPSACPRAGTWWSSSSTGGGCPGHRPAPTASARSGPAGGGRRRSGIVHSTLVSGFLPVVESTTWSLTSCAVPSSSRTRTPVTCLPTHTGSVMFFGSDLGDGGSFLRAGVRAVVDGFDVGHLPPASVLVPDLDRELGAGVAVPLNADEIGVGADLAFPSGVDRRRARGEVDLVHLGLRLRRRPLPLLAERGCGQHAHRRGCERGAGDELRAAGPEADAPQPSSLAVHQSTPGKETLEMWTLRAEGTV